MRIILLNLQDQKPNPVYAILGEALRQRGHEVIIAAMSDSRTLQWRGADGVLHEQDLGFELPSWAKSLPIVPGLLNQWHKIGRNRTVRNQLIKLAPDIVQVNTLGYPNLLPLAMPESIHFTYDVRQINESYRDGLAEAVRERIAHMRMWLAGRYGYDYTFFCHAEAARRILGQDWPRYSAVIPVAVDEAFLRHNQPTDLPADDEPVRFQYIGTLSPLRNLEQLFRAAQLLHAEGLSAFRIELTGPDHSDGKYQRLIDEAGMGDVVTMRGAVPYDEIPALLAQGHVGLAYVPDRPTWHYQPTIKIMEYRALGLPILSTDVASHRDYVTDGVNGVMVADTPESIAAGMRRFIADRGFLRDTHQNAQAMRHGSTWAQIAAMYEETYAALMSKAATSQPIAN